MAVYFISDLHLRSDSEERAQKFRQFLSKQPQADDILVLGGDIFDLFIGDKEIFKTKFSETLAALRLALAAKVTVFYLEGNHDFHLENALPKHKNLKIYQNDFSFQSAGKRFWVSHGDLIDKRDYGYRFLRFSTRTAGVKKLIAALPDGFFEKLGQWSSGQSRKYNSLEKMNQMQRERTQSLFREFAADRISHGFDYVFIGHSHIEDRFPIKMGERYGEYVNLGFFENDLPYALYSEKAQALTLHRV